MTFDMVRIVKLDEKATGYIKKNKNNFINVIGDKFALSIR